MPIGSSMVIPYIVEQLYPPPGAVLDVGIGYGMNGALVRQYSFGGQEMNRYKQQFLLGIEPFEKYRTPLWDVYNDVDSIDLGLWLTPANLELRLWNLILMTDVIEHFEKEEGVQRLEQLIARLAPGGKLLVSTPAIWIEQGAAYGNEYERHRSLWDCDDFRKLGFKIAWDGTPQRGQMMIVAVYKNGEVE